MNIVVLIGRLTANPVSHAGEKHESASFRLAIPGPAPTPPTSSTS
jgi:hypothetical protein